MELLAINHSHFFVSSATLFAWFCFRYTLHGKYFYLWQAGVEESRHMRMLRRMAILHNEERIKRNALVTWRHFTLESQRQLLNWVTCISCFKNIWFFVPPALMWAVKRGRGVKLKAPWKFIVELHAKIGSLMASYGFVRTLNNSRIQMVIWITPTI